MVVLHHMPVHEGRLPLLLTLSSALCLLATALGLLRLACVLADAQILVRLDSLVLVAAWGPFLTSWRWATVTPSGSAPDCRDRWSCCMTS